MSVAGRGGTYLSKPKRNRAVSFTIAAIVVVAGVVGISLVLKSSFHYQESSEGISRVTIYIDDLKGADLLIEQGETSQLAYSVTIETPSLTTSWGVLDYQVHPLENETGNRVLLNFNFKMNITRMTITLSPNMKYRFSVEGTDLNTTVLTTPSTYITRFTYSCTGNLSLFLDECNSDAQDSFVFVGGVGPRPDYVALYVDLPSGFEGELRLPGPGIISVLNNIGWSFDGDDTFTAGTGTPPGIYVQFLQAEEGYVLWLQA